MTQPSFNDETGKLRCGAKTRSGGTCNNAPMVGSTRCRMHGGATPRGIASPSFKHGRYSSVLPARLRERYEEALNDPDLLSLNDEIVINDLRLSELIGQINEGGGTGDVWQKLLNTYEQVKKASSGIEMAAALTKLEQLIQEGASWTSVYHEFRETLECRRRLVDTERRRRVDMQNYITAGQAMTMVAHLSDLVRSHVSNPAERNAIAAGLARFAAIRAGSIDVDSD